MATHSATSSTVASTLTTTATQLSAAQGTYGDLHLHQYLTVVLLLCRYVVGRQYILGSTHCNVLLEPEHYRRSLHLLRDFNSGGVGNVIGCCIRRPVIGFYFGVRVYLSLFCRFLDLSFFLFSYFLLSYLPSDSHG